MHPAKRCVLANPRALGRVRLLVDERGSVLLLGVFLGVFLAALLYFVMGTGAVIRDREGLQDAADSAAFGAAILHARGMNLIALVNLVMAALVAVLVACRVVQGLCLLGTLIAASLAPSTFGASLSVVPPLKSAMTFFEQAHRSLQSPILQTVGVLHRTQQVIARAVPPVAVIDAALETSRHHPPARWAFVLPGRASLPVEPDRFEVLCERAGETVVDLAMLPFASLKLGVVAQPLRKALGTMTRSAASFFCGAGGASPPVYERTERVHYPRSAAARRCEQEMQEPDGGAAACREAERELGAARPEEKTGACRAGEDCSLRGPYVRLAREAREQCRPRGGFAPVAYTWQEREVRVEYTYRRGRGWVQTDVVPQTSRLHTDRPEAPCGPRGALSTEWNLDPFPTGRLDELVPLCAEEHTAPTEEAIDGDRVTRTYREAAHIFGCEVYETRRDEPFAGGEPIRGGTGQRPHRMLSKIALGDESFQLRAVSGGKEPGSSAADKAVARATWKQRPPPDSGLGAALFGAAAPLRSLAVAQAEFYYDHDGNEAPSEWLWNMKWTARLVRFRGRQAEASPHEDRASRSGRLANVDSFASACQAAGLGSCDTVDEDVSAWEGYVLH